MKILSLFDGMACWYEALIRAGINVEKYYASEIDKYAIQIALKNHPDIIEIWDVTQVKWEDYKDVDIIMWWSPCQWFSMAWKMLNFDDPRSKLFFEFVRLVREIKPKYFLLENVKMKKEFQDVITEQLWVKPIEINSALVSAQNRKRLYWTNIPNITQPEDKGILLKDILEKNASEKYNLTEKGMEKLQRNFENKWQALAVDPMVAYAPWSREFEQQWFKTDKSPTLCARDYKDPKIVLIPTMVRVRKYEVDTEKLKSELRNRKFTSNLSCREIADKLWIPHTKVEHRFRLDDSFAIPDPEIRFKLKELLEINTSEFDKSITEFEEREWIYEKADRKISVEWKMTTLTTSWNDEIIELPCGTQLWQSENFGTSFGSQKAYTLRASNPNGVIESTRIRKLTPIECERLQTLPDNYTEWVSNTQRYKMLWNWWTVDVIAHIFSFIPKQNG